MVKKNRSHFSIAVLLTTLICTHLTTAYSFFWFYDCNFEILGACNTPLEMYFQDLPSDILKAPKFLKFQFVNPKKMHSFSVCRSGWSNEPQWENDCGSFLPCFLLLLVVGSQLKEVGI